MNVNTAKAWISEIAKLKGNAFIQASNVITNVASADSAKAREMQARERRGDSELVKEVKLVLRDYLAKCSDSGIQPLEYLNSMEKCSSTMLRLEDGSASQTVD